jgi:hypothetical protein
VNSKRAKVKVMVNIDEKLFGRRIILCSDSVMYNAVVSKNMSLDGPFRVTVETEEGDWFHIPLTRNEALKLVNLDVPNLSDRLPFRLIKVMPMKSKNDVDEKAHSKSQQRLFGLAHAIQKGDVRPKRGSAAAKIASNASKKDVKDFASTKHKDLPDKVGESELLGRRRFTAVLDDGNYRLSPGAKMCSKSLIHRMVESVQDIERQLMWDRPGGNIRHNVTLVVAKPIPVWVVIGYKPLNAYYGNAQVSGPTTEKRMLDQGTQINFVGGGLRLDGKTILLSNPDDHGPFEHQHGPGPYFVVAQLISRGILSFWDK